MGFSILGSNLGKEKKLKLLIILLFISIGSTSQYGGVSYHLNLRFEMKKREYRTYIDRLPFRYTYNNMVSTVFKMTSTTMPSHTQK